MVQYCAVSAEVLGKKTEILVLHVRGLVFPEFVSGVKVMEKGSRPLLPPSLVTEAKEKSCKTESKIRQDSIQLQGGEKCLKIGSGPIFSGR